MITSQLPHKYWDPIHTIMSNLFTPNYALTLLALVTIFILSNCSTTGMQRSEKVQSSMETVDNDIKLVIVRLDAIGNSLDELVKPGQADTKRAFDVFSENVSDIKKMQENFSKHAAEMEKSGKEYFEQWDKDAKKYANPEIQLQSEQRRRELGKGLTSAGIDSITRISGNVVNNGTRLKNELTLLQSAIEEAREKMKSN
jgi:hypothetical protein